MTTKTILTWLLAGLALLPAAPPAFAQDAADERPRIGLVLGGGGARGAAHIGVLRELERLQVPVHAIVGTSMGAIVGGLYAAGRTPAELEELILSLDWRDSLRDKPGRRELPFRRKQDDAAYPIQFELGLRDGRLTMPRGLVQGQRLGNVLHEMTGSTAGIRDFDRLPIPFRAVASDIGSGEAFVMGDGDLTATLRASMSVPGVFAPVEIDGRSLVDGGLVGNLPIEITRETRFDGHAVDVIIAVDVEFPLYEPGQLDTAVDISAQMLTILIRKETLRQIDMLRERDILIRPELGQFGSSDFAHIGEAVEPGAAAVRELEGALRRLSLPDDAWRQHLAGRSADRRPPREIDFVRIAESGPLTAQALESRLSTQAGDLLDTGRLASDTAEIYALDLYERVDYEIVEEDGMTGVVFRATPKSWGPNYLRFGLNLEDDFEGTTSFNLSTRLTRTGVNRLGAEWRSDLQFGTEPQLVSEFYQPFDFDARYFVAPRIDLSQRNLRTFSGDTRIARYRLNETEVGIDGGRELGRWGEFRIGAFRGTGNARLKLGDPTLPDIDFETGGFFARFAVDTLDDAQIPLTGTRFDLRWHMSRPGMGADNEFDSLETDFVSVGTRGRHSLLFGVSFSTTLETDNQVQNFFPLGGFLRMSGLSRGEISGPHAGVARLVWYRRSGETGGGLFEVPLYLGASIEAGNVWQRRSDISSGSLLMNGSVFVGLDTYFGPLYIAAGLAERGRSNFYLALGAPPP